MSDEKRKSPLLSAAAIAAMPECRRQHAFNPNGVRMTRSLGDACGLSQVGVHLVRVEPGHDSTEYHTHSHDEEWIYILSGRGVTEIGDERHEVKAGDFMGFTVNSAPHGMTNPFKEDLVYLVGGTRQPYDVIDYPHSGIRSYKYDGRRDNVLLKNLEKSGA